MAVTIMVLFGREVSLPHPVSQTRINITIIADTGSWSISISVTGGGHRR
jgi:hypothetical protein